MASNYLTVVIKLSKILRVQVKQECDHLVVALVSRPVQGGVVEFVFHSEIGSILDIVTSTVSLVTLRYVLGRGISLHQRGQPSLRT